MEMVTQTKEKEIKLENGSIINTAFGLKELRQLPTFSHTTTAGMRMRNAVILFGNDAKGIKYYEVYLGSNKIIKIATIEEFYVRNTIWKRNWYN